METTSQDSQFLSNLPCFRCTFTQDFHDSVIASLAKLTTGQEAILGRLDKINGSVRELYRRTDEHAKEIAVIGSERKSARTDATDAKTRIEKIEKKVDQMDTSAKTTSGILKKLEPVIWAAAGAFLLLLFRHADVVMAGLGKK